jgi:non-heme chloroperoxidase
VATGSSPHATYACVDTLLTDFRADLPKIDIPVLVLHGTADRILPFEVTAARLPALIADCTLVPVEEGPHNIAWTYPEEVKTRHSYRCWRPISRTCSRTRSCSSATWSTGQRRV